MIVRQIKREIEKGQERRNGLRKSERWKETERSERERRKETADTRQSLDTVNKKVVEINIFT